MAAWGWLAVVTALVFSACRQDCSEEARAGDFEASQGNYVNAIKHYERALKVDAHCGVVQDKLDEAKRKAEVGH